MNKSLKLYLFFLIHSLYFLTQLLPSGRLIQQQNAQTKIQYLVKMREELYKLAGKNDTQSFNMIINDLFNRNKNGDLGFYLESRIAKPLAMQAIVFFQTAEETDNPNNAKKAEIAAQIILTNPLLEKMIKNMTFLKKIDWGFYPDQKTRRFAKFFDKAFDKHCPDNGLLFLFNNEYFPGTEEATRYVQKLREEQEEKRMTKKMRTERSKEFNYRLPNRPSSR